MKKRIILGLGWVVVAVVGAQKPSHHADPWLASPVDQATYQTYLDFFSYSSSIPFDLEVVADESANGLRKRRLEFTSTPNERVRALHYQAVGKTQGVSDAVIIVHGGSPGGKDSPWTDNLASFLARGGFEVLSLDMLHFGERVTGLLETYTESEKHERLYNQPPLYLEWIIQTVKDIRRGLDLMIQEMGIAEDHIGLVGFSRGGQVALIAGAVEIRFRAVMALHAGHFDAFETGHLPPACPANHIGRIAPRPLFLLNSVNDTDYRRDISSLPMHKLAGEPLTARWTETGHGVLTNDDLSVILKWLRKQLSPNQPMK